MSNVMMIGIITCYTDPDCPERERELMKSVEVREDMRAMDARKRVSEILNSQAFREELEEIIESQVGTGKILGSFVPGCPGVIICVFIFRSACCETCCDTFITPLLLCDYLPCIYDTAHPIPPPQQPY